VGIKKSPDEIAAGWMARIDRSSLTASENQELQLWLGSDIRHEGAFVRAQAIWYATERAKALHNPMNFQHSRTNTVSRRTFFSTAAAMALFCVPMKSGEASTKYKTENNIFKINEKRKSVILDCYSEVNSKSDFLSISYGRCFFSGVNHCINMGNIFAIVNGSMLITKNSLCDSALVTNGTAVIYGKTLSPERRILAGTEIIIRPQEKIRIGTVEQERMRRLTDWTRGEVLLETETLSEASEIFNRYNSKQIVVSMRLAGLRLSGMFDLTKPDLFATAVEAVLGGVIRRDSNNIYLE